MIFLPDSAPEFLTEEYLQGLSSSDARLFGDLQSGLSGTLTLSVSGGPGGQVKGKTHAALKLTKGKITQASLGANKAAELKLEATYELAQALFGGEADPVEQYMAGNLKASGDMTLWFDVLPAWQGAVNT